MNPTPRTTTQKPSSKTTTKAGKTAQPASSKAQRQIIFDPGADRLELAEKAIADLVILETLVDNLSGDQRRIRQFSAATLDIISKLQPELLVGYLPDIVDALHRPEAQTRWECLEALSSIVKFNPEACDDAIVGAEASLYDDSSGSARLAAVRFLCAYGALDTKRANRVWPFIDEAIQCYHGDPEFQDMLASVSQFASGKIGIVVKRALSERMSFDAKNSKGQLGRRATAIVEICGI